MSTLYIGRTTMQLAVEKDIADTTYTKVASIIYGGKLEWGAVTQVLVCASKESGAGDYDLRIRDVDNGLTICEILGVVPEVPTISDLGEISNLPDAPAVWELQCRRPGQAPKNITVDVVAITF